MEKMLENFVFDLMVLDVQVFFKPLI